MPTDGVPVQEAGGALTPLSQLSGGPKQDFTYKKISGLRMSGLSFRQSLFVGAIVENCHFVNTNFDRCDFAGAKVVRCTFDNCQFVPTEFRSCEITESKFNSCNFRGVQWL